jgi:hypothetical protein
MLDAFIADRDYPRAEKLARLVDARFAGTRFHDHARRLLRELPLRRDDFDTLKLPTAEEWARVRKTLSRADQIDYLCKRLRLLNCFQQSIPGWIEPKNTQYAEASKSGALGFAGLSLFPAREVINPLTELTDAASPTRARLADVPRLAAHLRDDWSILALGYGKLIAPSYVLLTTRPLIADVINGLARKDICRLERWPTLTARQRDQEIARIAAWAKVNEGKTEVQLEWEALDEELAAGADWYTVEKRVAWLLGRNQRSALTVLHRYLLDARTTPPGRAGILDLCDKYDPVLASWSRDWIPERLRARTK